MAQIRVTKPCTPARHSYSGIAELHKAFTALHITEQLTSRHHVHKNLIHCH